jgi:hypothetical protein
MAVYSIDTSVRKIQCPTSHTTSHLVFLKKKDATRKDFENIMHELINEIGLEMTLEFQYKFLVLLYIEADEKMDAKKHYFGLTYDNH